jgi:hypothetical protein
MNAITPIEMEGVVERFDDLGELDEGWEALSRTDLRQEEETRVSVTRVRRALWVTVAILFILNSAGLVQLVQGLSIGPVQDTVIVMSETWNEEMERHGVTQILSDIRARVEGLVNRSWDEVAHLRAPVVSELRLNEVGDLPTEKDRATVLRSTVLDPSGS